MKTLEEVCQYVKSSTGKGLIVHDWMGRYTEYMKAEMHVIEAKKLNHSNPYFIKKLEAERDYIKYGLEQLEELMK
jgi:hypothetical protein